MAIDWAKWLFVSFTLSFARGYREVSLLLLVDEHSDELISDCAADRTGITSSDVLFNFTVLLESELDYNYINCSNFIGIVDASCSVHQPIMGSLTTVSACRDFLISIESVYNVVPSDSLLAPGLVAAMDTYGWGLVKVFTENNTLYDSEHTELVTALAASDIDVISAVIGPNSDVGAEILFNDDPHIFVLNTGYAVGLNILCEAYKNDLYYPNFAWILLNWADNGWMASYDDYEIDCIVSEIMVTLNRALILLPYPDGDYREMPGSIYNILNYTEDAISVFEHAYQRCDLSSSCIEGIIFEGSTGTVQFSGNSRLSSTVLVTQYRIPQNRSIPIGIVNTTVQLKITQWTNNSYIWPGGIPPDGTPIQIVNSLKPSVIISMSVLMSIALVCIIICLAFNIIFRNTKVVKLISPNLNYVMMLGLFLLVLAGIPYRPSDIPARKASCLIGRLCLSLGYDIIIGIAVLKNFRVYYIFKTTTVKKRVLTDGKLLIMLLLMLLVEVILAHILSFTAILVEGIDYTVDASIEPDKNSQCVRQEYFILSCGIQYLTSTIYIAIVVLYKIVINIAGLVLSILTRKVEIDVLNDYKSTSALIYSSTVIIALFVVGAFATRGNFNLDEIVYGTLIFIIIMLFLGLVFVPKMIALYKDPKGNRIFQTTVITADGKTPDLPSEMPPLNTRNNTLTLP